METTKNQLRIIELFRKNPLTKLSILQIAKQLKSRSYQRIYEAVKRLEKEQIINIEKIGKSSLVQLNLSRNAILNFSFLDEKESIKKVPNYNKILDLREISDYLVMVTGSYAKGTSNNKSDLDLVVIVPDNIDIVKLQGVIENLTMLFIPKVHLYVLRKKDFLEMLLEKKENYGKEIFRNHLILKNAQAFYELLKEATENGFKG